MSKISIEGDASGTGTLTIAAPNTNTNRTLTLPDATGTLALTSAALTGTTDSGTPFETSLGTDAGAVNTGVNNTFIGFEAGSDTTSATNNTAVGFRSLYLNTSTGSNTAIGSEALYNGGSNDDVAIGREALYTEDGTGNGQNVAIGSGASKVSTASAFNNVCIGYRAAFVQTSGVGNTIIGAAVAANLTTASSTTIVGNSSGANLTTGNGGTYIGASATASAGGATNEIVLCVGNGPTGKGNNTAFINANGGNTFNGANTTVFATVSDQRIKKNIVENTEGLGIISQLRVCNFEYRTEEEVTDLPSHAVINKIGVQLGVIAQELQQVCPDCVTEQSTGVLSVDTDEIFWHMVNAVKELKAELDQAKTRIAALENNNA
jgi:trimeric autotransporter adhesin